MIVQSGKGGTGGGGGSGTVTTFSAGDLSNVFTTGVTAANTTPHLTFTLVPQTAYTFSQIDSTGNAVRWVNILGSNVISVDAATTTTLPAYTYANGASGVGATITINATGVLPSQDGVTLVLNNTLLVKNETGSNAPYNAVYTYTTAGAVGVQAVFTRSTNADSSAELTNEVVIPTGGTTNKNVVFSQQTDFPTIGTDDILYDNGAPTPTTRGWLTNLNNANANQNKFGTRSNQDVRLYTNATQVGAFFKTGEFGWGITASPSGKVHIQGTTHDNSANALYISNNTPANILKLTNDGGLSVGINTISNFHANINTVGNGNTVTTTASGSIASFIYGINNTSGNTSGSNYIIGDTNNNSIGDYIFGTTNVHTSGSAAGCFVVGDTNTITSNSAHFTFVFGYLNSVANSVVVGRNNTAASGFGATYIFGEGNNGTYNPVIVGANNNIFNSGAYAMTTYNVVIGEGLTLPRLAGYDGSINFGMTTTTGNLPQMQFKGLGQNVLLIGTDAAQTNFDTSSINRIMLLNGTAPTTLIAHTISIGSKNTSDSNSSLELTTEQTVASETVVSDRTLKITLNGVQYKICLKA